MIRYKYYIFFNIFRTFKKNIFCNILKYLLYTSNKE